MEDYVPDAPIAYDARYLDDSFEGNQGFGWDTCHTRTPGKDQPPSTGGSEGTSHVTFESAACARACLAHETVGVACLHLVQRRAERDPRMGLYFDVKNLSGSGAVPTGVLRFYGTD